MDLPRKPVDDDNVDSDPYSPNLNADLPPPPPPPPEALPPPAAPPEPLPAGAISRAPVRYNLPPAPSEIPSSEAELEKALAAEPEDEDISEANAEDAPRSLRPGQKGFAERLMSKYGWSKGMYFSEYLHSSFFDYASCSEIRFEEQIVAKTKLSNLIEEALSKTFVSFEQLLTPRSSQALALALMALELSIH
jgi:hypothetical protein